jgi:hypothetical protein
MVGSFEPRAKIAWEMGTVPFCSEGYAKIGTVPGGFRSRQLELEAVFKYNSVVEGGVRQRDVRLVNGVVVGGPHLCARRFHDQAAMLAKSVQQQRFLIFVTQYKPHSRSIGSSNERLLTKK